MPREVRQVGLQNLHALESIEHAFVVHQVSIVAFPQFINPVDASDKDEDDSRREKPDEDLEAGIDLVCP